MVKITDLSNDIVASIFAIILLGLIQLLVYLQPPFLLSLFKKSPEREPGVEYDEDGTRKMPEIMTVDKDPEPEETRKRHKKSPADIANWVQSSVEATPQNETLANEGLVPSPSVRAGEEYEPDVTMIRQQMIDRTMVTPMSNDPNTSPAEEASIKVEIIKSIKSLSDEEVTTWYRENGRGVLLNVLDDVEVGDEDEAGIAAVV